jgi:hypothetical protein
MHPSASQKMVPIILLADGIVLVSFLLMNPIDAIPYSAASFHGRNGETNFHRLSQY